MKPEFIQTLIGFLKERGELGLPGIGKFVWQHHEVEVVPQDQYAAPAGEYASFFPVQSEVQLREWIQYVQAQLLLSDMEAKALNEAWIAEFNEGLQREGIYEMTGFGRMYKKSGRIYFVPEKIEWDPEYFGLPVVPARVITYSEEEKRNLFQEPLIVHRTDSENKPSEWSFWDVIISLCLSALILFFLAKTIEIFLNGKDSLKPGQKSEVQKEIRDSAQAITPIILPKEKPLAGTYKEDKEVVEEHIGKPCVIIVGSFKSARRAERLKERVISNGYLPFTQEYGAYHRVGVKFDCLTEDLYRKLFVLRGAFGKDAWILLYDK